MIIKWDKDKEIQRLNTNIYYLKLSLDQAKVNAVLAAQSNRMRAKRIDQALTYIDQEIERCKQTENSKQLSTQMQNQAFIIRERLQEIQSILIGG